MGDKTPATTTQNQTQSSTTNPWSAATPLLQNLISQYSAQPTSPTQAQTDAAGSLVSSASQIPNFGNAAASGISNIFGSSYAPQVGMLNNGYSQLQQNLGSTANGSQLNPYDTPGFSDSLNTAMSDITNQVKGVYAGSGRDPSGAGSFAGSLGRGLTQGIAPIIQSQYNTNKANQLNAAGTLYNASGTTANNLTGTNAAGTANTLAGLQGAGALSGIYTSPATAMLGAANTQQQLPYSSLQSLLSAAGLLGGMGSSSTGTSSGTGTSTPANDPMANWIGGISAGAGLLFSDANLKENIEPVGKTFDGQDIFVYNYKGEDTPQMGMLAQSVLKHEPSAVHKVGDFLAVDYKAATSKARKINAGMLQMKEAA